MRFVLFAFAALNALGADPVRVWQSTLTLPTYAEGQPDANPPFDQLQPAGYPFVYPYAMRTNLTSNVSRQGWRALNLENEYLRCTVLPDLGGHLYSCLDKPGKREMFYANSVVKKQWVGLRGSWAGLGLESNFPVTHTLVGTSPVDFGAASNADGSGSVFVGAVDRVSGMQWWSEFILRPGAAVLEQKVTLYNRSDARRRYYWWANAEVRLEGPQTRIIWPAYLSATHGFTQVDTWPVNGAGVDMSVMGNHKDSLGLFAHGSREPFLAAYQPVSRSGLVHYADPKDLPGKKLWTWGTNDKFAPTSLSDDHSTYIEIQAGTARDQETYDFLEPGQQRVFSEYWMPVHELGGVSRANLSGILNLQRGKESEGTMPLTVEFLANAPLAGVTLRVLRDGRTVLDEKTDLDPARPYSKTLSVASGAPYLFQLVNSGRTVLLEHTEGKYDALTEKDYAPGPQAPPAWRAAQRSEDDFLAFAGYSESQGKWDDAINAYEAGLRQYAGSAALAKGSGRIFAVMGRFGDAVPRLSSASAKLPDDDEIRYYLGLAYAGLGETDKARQEWRSAGRAFLPAASLQLAYLLSSSGDTSGALDTLRSGLAGGSAGTRAGAVEVALLRALGRRDEAAARLKYWLALAPADLTLRFEQYQLGQDDALLWRRLGADPERVLDLAEHFMRLGQYREASGILDRQYALVPPLETEPGGVLPQAHPLIAYYRGYCRERAGASGADDYRLASQLSSKYVFPSRASSLAPLQAALQINPGDATAHYLLGSVYLSMRLADNAILEWQRARAIRKDLPALHRNLGRALLDVKKDAKGALEVLAEGEKRDPSNADLQQALGRARAAAGK